MKEMKDRTYTVQKPEVKAEDNGIRYKSIVTLMYLWFDKSIEVIDLFKL